MQRFEDFGLAKRRLLGSGFGERGGGGEVRLWGLTLRVCCASFLDWARVPCIFVPSEAVFYCPASCLLGERTLLKISL